jgi:ABC-type transport system involved in cytochrome bd biosynthesis fused ATPase/permease subunit
MITAIIIVIFLIILGIKKYKDYKKETELEDQEITRLNKQILDCYNSLDTNMSFEEFEASLSRNKEDEKIDLRSEIAKGVRDGIAKSNYEHGESFGAYGSSDYLFK